MFSKKIELISNEFVLFLVVVTTGFLIKFNILNITFDYIVIALILFYLFVIIEKYTREVKYLNSLNLLSTVCSTSRPTPGKSMFNALRTNGFEPEDIKEVFMMSYSLKHDYLTNSEFSRTMKNLNVKFNLYGSYGTASDISKILNYYQQVEEIKNLNYHLTEHYNILDMKNGEVYIWYEPSHIVENNKDILNEGGYLFLAKDIETAKVQFYSIIENQSPQAA